MDIEIIEKPIRFRLHGLSALVEGQRYGEVGCRLMDEMWEVVKKARLKNGGITHWVYFGGNRMLVGVEVKDAEGGAIPDELEACAFELSRYARHVHVGAYEELPEKWRALMAELSGRGEEVVMPSLEVYEHSCEGDDEAETETVILLGIRRKGE